MKYYRVTISYEDGSSYKSDFCDYSDAQSAMYDWMMDDGVDGISINEIEDKNDDDKS